MPGPGPAVTLHVLPPSPPCRTVEAALRLKGLAYERVDLQPGKHQEAMAEIYGPARTTVPGVVIDGTPVHGSVAILERLEELAPEPALYPAPIAEAVHEAERWGDGRLQDLSRYLPWGAMHFRPESLGTFGGGGALDAAGTDYAIKVIRGTWRYHGLTAVVLHEALQDLPALLDHVDALAADGTIGTDHVTAADLQIGASLRVLLTVGDLHPLMAGRPGEEIARRLFPDYPGLVPAGALPAGWVPER
ncbi:glutathione S-transferase [Patulibacter minatonensis]|uniref:glutathione S-transferase n=1 Tax=Patulibacter minatonensis TaxID=298163 RepID=UPI0004B8CF3D|nr:glutathione S-transferase [Patulibacter minatonensis]